LIQKFLRFCIWRVVDGTETDFLNSVAESEPPAESAPEKEGTEYTKPSSEAEAPPPGK
jgi:hypothetical protein